MALDNYEQWFSRLQQMARATRLSMEELNAIKDNPSGVEAGKIYERLFGSASITQAKRFGEEMRGVVGDFDKLADTIKNTSNAMGTFGKTTKFLIGSLGNLTTVLSGVGTAAFSLDKGLNLPLNSLKKLDSTFGDVKKATLDFQNTLFQNAKALQQTASAYNTGAKSVAAYQAAVEDISSATNLSKKEALTLFSAFEQGFRGVKTDSTVAEIVEMTKAFGNLGLTLEDSQKLMNDFLGAGSSNRLLQTSEALMGDYDDLAFNLMAAGKMSEDTLRGFMRARAAAEGLKKTGEGPEGVGVKFDKTATIGGAFSRAEAELIKYSSSMSETTELNLQLAISQEKLFQANQTAIQVVSDYIDVHRKGVAGMSALGTTAGQLASTLGMMVAPILGFATVSKMFGGGAKGASSMFKSEGGLTGGKTPIGGFGGAKGVIVLAFGPSALNSIRMVAMGGGAAKKAVRRTMGGRYFVPGGGRGRGGRNRRPWIPFPVKKVAGRGLMRGLMRGSGSVGMMLGGPVGMASLAAIAGVSMYGYYKTQKKKSEQAKILQKSKRMDRDEVAQSAMSGLSRLKGIDGGKAQQVEQGFLKKTGFQTMGLAMGKADAKQLEALLGEINEQTEMAQKNIASTTGQAVTQVNKLYEKWIETQGAMKVIAEISEQNIASYSSQVQFMKQIYGDAIRGATALRGQAKALRESTKILDKQSKIYRDRYETLKEEAEAAHAAGDEHKATMITMQAEGALANALTAETKSMAANAQAWRAEIDAVLLPLQRASELQQTQVGYTTALRDLHTEIRLGIGVSYQDQLRVAAELGNQSKLYQEQANALMKMASLEGDRAAKVKLLQEARDKETQSIRTQTQMVKELKQVREGYLDAMKESVFGAGAFGEFFPTMKSGSQFFEPSARIGREYSTPEQATEHSLQTPARFTPTGFQGAAPGDYTDAYRESFGGKGTKYREIIDAGFAGISPITAAFQGDGGDFNMDAFVGSMSRGIRTGGPLDVRVTNPADLGRNSGAQKLAKTYPPYSPRTGNYHEGGDISNYYIGGRVSEKSGGSSIQAYHSGGDVSNINFGHSYVRGGFTPGASGPDRYYQNLLEGSFVVKASVTQQPSVKKALKGLLGGGGVTDSKYSGGMVKANIAPGEAVIPPSIASRPGMGSALRALNGGDIEKSLASGPLAKFSGGSVMGKFHDGGEVNEYFSGDKVTKYHSGSSISRHHEGDFVNRYFGGKVVNSRNVKETISNFAVGGVAKKDESWYPNKPLVVGNSTLRFDKEENYNRAKKRIKDTKDRSQSLGMSLAMSGRPSRVTSAPALDPTRTTYLQDSHMHGNRIRRPSRGTNIIEKFYNEEEKPYYISKVGTHFKTKEKKQVSRSPEQRKSHNWAFAISALSQKLDKRINLGSKFFAGRDKGGLRRKEHQEIRDYMTELHNKAMDNENITKEDYRTIFSLSSLTGRSRRFDARDLKSEFLPQERKMIRLKYEGKDDLAEIIKLRMKKKFDELEDWEKGIIIEGVNRESKMMSFRYPNYKKIKEKTANSKTGKGSTKSEKGAATVVYGGRTPKEQHQLGEKIHSITRGSRKLFGMLYEEGKTGDSDKLYKRLQTQIDGLPDGSKKDEIKINLGKEVAKTSEIGRQNLIQSMGQGRENETIWSLNKSSRDSDRNRYVREVSEDFYLDNSNINFGKNSRGHEAIPQLRLDESSQKFLSEFQENAGVAPKKYSRQSASGFYGRKVLGFLGDFALGLIGNEPTDNVFGRSSERNKKTISPSFFGLGSRYVPDSPGSDLASKPPVDIYDGNIFHQGGSVDRSIHAGSPYYKGGNVSNRHISSFHKGGDVNNRSATSLERFIGGKVVADKGRGFGDQYIATKADGGPIKVEAGEVIVPAYIGRHITKMVTGGSVTNNKSVKSVENYMRTIPGFQSGGMPSLFAGGMPSDYSMTSQDMSMTNNYVESASVSNGRGGGGGGGNVNVSGNATVEVRLRYPDGGTQTEIANVILQAGNSRSGSPSAASPGFVS